MKLVDGEFGSGHDHCGCHSFSKTANGFDDEIDAALVGHDVAVVDVAVQLVHRHLEPRGAFPVQRKRERTIRDRPVATFRAIFSCYVLFWFNYFFVHNGKNKLI